MPEEFVHILVDSRTYEPISKYWFKTTAEAETHKRCYFNDHKYATIATFYANSNKDPMCRDPEHCRGSNCKRDPNCHD